MSACEILEERPQILAIFSFTEAVHTLPRACLPLWALRNHTVSSQPARKEFNPCLSDGCQPIRASHTFMQILMGTTEGTGKVITPTLAVVRWRRIGGVCFLGPYVIQDLRTDLSTERHPYPQQGVGPAWSIGSPSAQTIPNHSKPFCDCMITGNFNIIQLFNIYYLRCFVLLISYSWPEEMHWHIA